MSKKSPKQNPVGNPSSIANAMYDAQKKEITSSMVLSLSFIGAGLIVAIVGVFQYLHTESYDAGAWLVIAGVGLLVGIIGFISVMKSFVSLGQIGNWAKEAESHASPFQSQKVIRKVAAMNQSQSMEKAAVQGMDEGNAPKKRRGFFNRGKESKGKGKSEDLYYKYNPQKKPEAPQKSAPVMEQKFDYGIHEAKQLTFADEFLKKNKRDPFAQYRKDLGIQEEAEPVYEQKPKFVVNNPPAAKPIAAPVLSPLQKNNAAGNADDMSSHAQNETSLLIDDASTETAAASGKSSFPSFMTDEMEQGIELNLGLSFGYDDDKSNSQAEQENVQEKSSESEASSAQQEDYTAFLDNFAETKTTSDESAEKSEDTYSFETFESKPKPEPEPEPKIEIESKPEPKVETKPELPISSVSSAVSASPYGTHNEDDDDMFFSAKAQKADFVQKASVSRQKQQNVSASGFTPDKGSSIAKKSSSKKKKAEPTPTVMLDLDYKKSESPSPSPTVMLDLDYKKKDAPPTVMLDIDYKKQDSSSEYDFSLFEDISPEKDKKKENAYYVSQPVESNNYQSENNKPQQGYGTYVKPEVSVSQQSINESKVDSSPTYFKKFEEPQPKAMHNEPSPSPIPPVSPAPPAPPAQPQHQRPIGRFRTPDNPPNPPSIGAEKRQDSKRTPPPKSRNTRSSKHDRKSSQQSGEKKSFSEKFLNKNSGGESEIVKNGTRSQRKFVDASEYDEWSCPSCGKVNQEYVGVCACGTRKPRPRKH